MMDCTQPETYTIGFTENYYSATDDVHSPSPIEHVLGYTSPALDYAERSNKGAENVFLDKSLSIDRDRHKSVGKINHGILDLMFEISERRRKTPITGHSFREKRSRSVSELSDISVVSLKSSSSEPTLQVQQLLPRSQNRTLPCIKGRTVKLSAKQYKTQTNKKARDTAKDNDVDETNTLLSFPKTVSSYVAMEKEAKARKNITNSNNKNDQNSSNAGYDIEPTGESRMAQKVPNKWQKITEKLVEANKLVRNGTINMSAYKGRYHTPDFRDNSRRLSYCQCSYGERTEKERMANIMRRHISQANTGPIDLGILRRQITRGKSKTFVL